MWSTLNRVFTGYLILLLLAQFKKDLYQIHITGMFRPRGGLSRTVLNKIDNDRKLAIMDKSKWYKVDTEKLPPEIMAKFIRMNLDDQTMDFLERCIENSDNMCWQIWTSIATSILSLFISPTSINGLLGRGSMQVFSKTQFHHLIDWDGQVKESLLDIGAGDGTTTIQMAPAFSKIYVTEMSVPMKRSLKSRGFTVLDTHSWIEDERKYSMISCLNVLDRCDEPLKLLSQIRGKLEDDGLAIVSFVIPFSPYVEFDSTSHKPKELLPIQGNSFEVEILNFDEKVLKSNGWELIRWTRLPYLCDGDIHQAYYWLDDAVFLIQPTSNQAQ